MSPEAAAIDPEVLFKTQARYIGIGGIAMSGIIGIIKSWGIIRSAVGLAGREFRGKGGNVAKVKRTQKDISMKVLAFSLIAALAVTFAFFYFGVIHNLFQTLVAFGSINNYSREDYRRIDWTISIAYGDDYEVAKREILRAARNAGARV